MNISIIGAGYVGLVTGACFAEFGMDVLCMDIDEGKVDKLSKGVLPVYEPDLSGILVENISGRLRFTSSIKEAVFFSDIIFIAVNTPTKDDGASDLSRVFSVGKDIAHHMQEYKLIVNKSTVPVFTGRALKEVVNNCLEQQNKHISFDIVSNPEFLQEGSAVKNFINPDRIVIGYESERALQLMKRIYSIQIARGIPLVLTNIETAELIKYASNAFLATKISFINEMANICERCGADVVTVAHAMGLDDRIGQKFLQAGPGFGGSCFPKDTKALMGIGKKIKYTPRIIGSVIRVNNRQRKLACLKIKRLMKSLDNRVVAVLGISFKPDTDDIRESPSIEIIKYLLNNKAIVKAYDPQAMENAKELHPDLNVQYCYDMYSACEGSDCVVLSTEWEEFRDMDFLRLKGIVRTPVFVDLRNVFEPGRLKNLGFTYEGVGRK